MVQKIEKDHQRFPPDRQGKIRGGLRKFLTPRRGRDPHII